MNYIRHLNAFFSFIRKDERLTSSHVSLYLALFQYWNFNRFQNPFSIYRDNIMQLSKIGSKNTYHKCMKELHHYSYLVIHTAATKYQPVKISIIRLDIKQPTTSYQQLDLFNSSPKTGTQSVSIMADTSTNNDTVQVPKSVHLIKPNILKTESNRHLQKNEEGNQNSTNNKVTSAGVPNSVHIEIPSPDEVMHYFIELEHPSIEGERFYNHYKALGWKVSNQHIEDWKALAKKWILNDSRHSKPSVESPKPKPDIPKEIRYLQQRYSEGTNMLQQITEEHFNYLNLQLTNEIKNEAVRKRIESLIGSNQHSVNKLLQAYQEGDINSQYIIKDQPNLVLLAQRIAVINHFNKLNKDTTDEH